ncbi:hypothetical protein ACQVUB_27625 [Bacillus mycoides]
MQELLSLETVSHLVYLEGNAIVTDSGAWKLKAIENIKNYLTENLAEEIENNKVFIIA